LLLLVDEERTLPGRQGQSSKDLLRRWQQVQGKVEVLVRILGVCRPSELAMQIADLQREKKATQRTCSWCHEVNAVTTRPSFCTKCGHRVDVVRLECNCARCQRKEES
jgi:hypothetical protein